MTIFACRPALDIRQVTENARDACIGFPARVRWCYLMATGVRGKEASASQATCILSAVNCRALPGRAAWPAQQRGVRVAPSSRSSPNGMGTDHPQLSLAYLPPKPWQSRSALAGAAVLLLGLAALAPFAAKPLPQVNGFVPALDAIIFVTDLITAILLSRALLVLACGYLFSALIVVAHGLTFPDAFFPTENLSRSLRINFRIYQLWHLGLPASLFVYVWLRDEDRTKASVRTPTALVGIFSVVSVLALVSGLVWLAAAGDELLPFPLNNLDRSSPFAPWLPALTMLICAVALSLLWAFRRSVLDQWLMVVVLASMIEMAITALLGGLGLLRFTVGFYTGRVFFSLVTSTVVLIALLAETTKLYQLEERLDERTRIARELHDTLLQSFQGAVFQFQTARKLLLRNADNAMQVVDEAIHAAEEGITEGRAAIHDLRPEPVAQRDLPELLNAAGRELADSEEPNTHSPRFRMTVEGKGHSLALLVQDEIYRISREVVRNAFAHAAAGHIEVEIRYDQDHLRVRIRDDGKGIDPTILEDGGRPGHWGITGMRERAQRIGAQLAFWGEVGAGTEVQLTVPGAIAYEKHQDGHRFRLSGRAGSDERRS
jgi:signal transduction histidine kinase